MLAYEFWHDFFHLFYRKHIITIFNIGYQAIYCKANRCIVVFPDSSNFDFFMKCRKCYFLIIKHFFIKFLSIAQTCEFYFHTIGTAKLNHTTGKVS